MSSPRPSRKAALRLGLPCGPGAAPAVLFVILLCRPAVAQMNEGDLVYRFTVQEIDDVFAAKAVQYELAGRESIIFCRFTDETDQFKLASHQPLSYAWLRDALLERGWVL